MYKTRCPPLCSQNFLCDLLSLLQMTIGQRAWNILLVYARLTRRQQEKHNSFLGGLERVIRNIPTDRTIVAEEDFSAYEGERSTEYLKEHGPHDFNAGNPEKGRILESLQALELCAASTGFKKEIGTTNNI